MQKVRSTLLASLAALWLAPVPAAGAPTPHSSPHTVPGAGIPKTPMGTVPKQNKAIYLGYKGHVDTDLAFSEFFAADHTVMAWYMPQYPHGDTGPIVAENGSGTYAFGQLDYREGDGGKEDAGSPVFFVQVGNKKVLYLLPEMVPGKWIHVAVVRKGPKFSLYVWGVKRTPVEVIDKATNATKNVPEIDVTSASGLPSGTLRIGRRTSGDTGSKAVWQAYGLVDDIAVFDKAMNGSEITTTIAKQRLGGHEAGLIAGWSFEDAAPKKPLPARLARPWTKSSRAYRMAVSDVRNSNLDKVLFDNPFIIGEVSADVQLPFKKNEVWKVVQGQDDPAGSHNGSAAFCYDFVVANQPKNGTYPKGTELAPVYAGAAGKVVKYRKDGAFDGPREPYFLKIRVGTNEHIGYLHLDENSLHDAAHGGTCDAEHDCTVAVEDADSIAKGAKVALLGPKAEHLHFGGTGLLVDGSTIPIAFSDYWASDDGGKTWVKVWRGHPKKGQLIKRIN
jgi:hypothetical protein